MSSELAPRRSGDACPGVDRPFSASDGSIVRLRPAGRPVSVGALGALLGLISDHERPFLQLTSRAALQVRGLPDPLPAHLRDAILATGLVPVPSHELVRNVIASPLSGLDLGHTDIRPLVRELDEAVCASPRLAELPGRFLFVLDDGRGDVVRESFDLALLATGSTRLVVFAGATDRGWVVDRAEAIPLVVQLAGQFLDRRSAPGRTPAWHVRELDPPLAGAPTCSVELPVAPLRPVGRVGGHAVVGVPLGLLTSAMVEHLARVTDSVMITPWRTLVVLNAGDEIPGLERAGFVTTATSPWLRLHACTGTLGCSRSTVDTHAIARGMITSGRMPPGLVPVHVSGCERRCGTPPGEFVDVLTPSSVAVALQTVDSATAGRGAVLN